MERASAPDGSGTGGHHGDYRALLADENFEFNEVVFHDPKVTGAQIAEAAGKHPVHDYIILQHLPSGELETLRPTELVDLRPGGDETFFVIKGDGTNKFVVDGLAFEWPRKRASGLTIKRLARKDDDDCDLIIEREDEPDRIIADDEFVDLDKRGVERFKTRPSHGPFVIFVDGEPYEPPRRQMTPNEIIRLAAQKDPAQFYLVQITRDGRISFEGKGDQPIKLRKGAKFQVISVGPTPVSDPKMKTGVKTFIEGLRALGYEPTTLPGNPDHVVFNYVVESGRFTGKEVRHGVTVPADFPMTPPGGVHVSPEIHPINTSGQHPLGAIHKEQARPFEAGAGGAWQYWSRPFPGWPASKRSVAAYLSHIWKLWDSQ